jgi:outer membrane protein
MSRTPRSLVVGLIVLVAAPSWATASFANKELGLGVSAFLLEPSSDALVTWGVPVTLEGGLYLENGFAVYARIPFMLLKQTDGALRFGTGGQVGFRYLFLEETVRPYIMFQAAGLYIFRDATTAPNFFVGPGAGAGVDFFVADSVSNGLRATADLYLTLTNTQLKAQVSLAGGVYATTYF